MNKINIISFSITPSKIPNSVVILFYSLPDEQDKCSLQAIKWNSEAAKTYIEATCREVPVEIEYHKGKIPSQFLNWIAVGCKVKDISEFNVSFEHFWNLYGKKVGGVQKICKKWNALPCEEKILALGAIPRIKQYYERNRIQLPYPETYLNQRRWENQFE